MQAQDVVNAVSTDMRQVLSSSGTDANIILSWVDRIQKDVLHTTLYSYFNRYSTTISVVAGTAAYTLSPTPAIRRIVSVYDRSFDRTLLPFDGVGNPVRKSDDGPSEPLQMPKPMLTDQTNSQWPEFYQRIGATNQLVLYPSPQKAAFDGTYEVTYEGLVPTVAALATNLVVPDDGLDIMVAGVNSLAAAYLKNPEDYQAYKQAYESMKAATFNG